jgi:hypothetical protein
MKISLLNQSVIGGNGIPATNHFIFENVETGEKFIIGETVVLQVHQNSKVETLVIPGVSFSRKTFFMDENAAKHVFLDYLKQVHNADGTGEMKIALTNLPRLASLFEKVALAFPSYNPDYV